ncbi:MAG TPA: SRPBCC domain-containing protein [Polyangiaceae bacterium]|nr:SRPBCC domain-containing protein [Polyangiaceae bacterium]
MEIRTEIEIAAPPSEVWRVLLDFRRYPEWNPFIVELKGEAKTGAALDLTISLPNSNSERVVRAQLLKCQPEDELRWLGHWWMKGLFDGEHFVRLETRGGGTRVVQGEDFSGVLLRFLMPRVTEAARGFVYMNQALKRRVESRDKPSH